MAAVFTDAVRQEVARIEPASAASAWAELAGLLRLVGTVELHPPRISLEVTTPSGAVARRVHGLVVRLVDRPPELLVRAPGGVHTRSTFRLRIEDGADELAVQLGILGRDRRVADDVPARVIDLDEVAWIRGVILASASISSPGRAPHLEIRVAWRGVAETVADRLRRRLDATVSVVSDARGGGRTRVVVKSGRAIGDLLVMIGASHAFLAWDDRRLRKQLRGEANRLANADAANLRRSIHAAARQVEQVEEVVDRLGWEAMDDDLRDIALARLANPAASLADLGELVDPPVTKSTVRRRLTRIAALTTDGDGG